MKNVGLLSFIVRLKLSEERKFLIEICFESMSSIRYIIVSC